MCGLLVFVGTAPMHHDAFQAGLATIAHRGPDETATDADGDSILFGFQRLAVIDPDGSHQPFRYADGRYLLAFNGEIYNYRELREALHQEGADFHTNGDTEVLAAAYHHWGASGLERLRGMFAFVLWDRQRRQAFGARDPFGIKPLYFLETPTGTFFATEKKALLPFTPTAHSSKGIDYDQLAHYLTFQYVPEPHTLHHGIKQVGAGQAFTYHPPGRVQKFPYHSAILRPTPASNANDTFRRIGDALRESVHRHMHADVPVGAFLSGGIDSAAIVALAREVNPDIRTFTAALDVPGYSEVDAALETAAQLDVLNDAVKIDAEMMMTALPDIVWHLDDPVADPSLVPLYHLARTAREHVTVVLSGEGADELFGGYPIYREPQALRAVTNLPNPVQKGLSFIARMVPEGIRGKSFLERGTTPLHERYCGNARVFTGADKRSVLQHPAAPHTDITRSVYANTHHLDDVAAMQQVDLQLWLRGDILAKADRMAMAHALELRVPYLDTEVFKVSHLLPEVLKVPKHLDITKYALRQAMRGILPPSTVRRPKLGFPTPIRVWLRTEMYPWARDILAESGAGHLLDLDFARGLLDAHRQGRGDHSRKIWSILIFCLWYAIFIDRTLAPGAMSRPAA